MFSLQMKNVIVQVTLNSQTILVELMIRLVNYRQNRQFKHCHFL